MCALSLLWPERSRAKTTWPGLSRRWYASVSCLGFSAVLHPVLFLVKLRDGGVDLDVRSSVFTGVVGEVLFYWVEGLVLSPLRESFCSFMCETASLYSVLGTALYLLLHGMIREALVFLCLKKDLCLSSLL